jgi:ribosome biogenesis protein MAK21
MPANLSCAILFLISEVSKTHKGIILLGTPTVKIDTIKEEDSDSEKESTDDEDGEGGHKEQRKKDRKTRRDLKSKKLRTEVDDFMKSSNIEFGPTEEEEKSKTKPQPLNPVHTTDVTESEVIEIKEEKDYLITEYDPAARNPSFCGAELTLAFELSCLAQHFHPSVALFAQTLLRQSYIKYDGNPLKDFTVGRFLERFVYRNAKVKRVS